MIVSVITPTTESRRYFNNRIRKLFDANTQKCAYDIEHLFDYSDKTIGEKLNILCAQSKGDIILRADSDDIYAPDWVAKSVDALNTSGADIVGLSNAYFYKTHNATLHEYSNQPNSQLYLCGATLCFHRKAWERKPFPRTSEGEDLYWQTGNGKLFAHDYKNGFIATIHGNNTCSHKALPIMKKVACSHPLLSWI